MKIWMRLFCSEVECSGCFFRELNRRASMGSVLVAATQITKDYSRLIGFVVKCRQILLAYF